MLPYSKAPSKKIMVQIKLVDMPMIFQCTQFNLTKCNCSWVLLKFNIQSSSMFIYLDSHKCGLMKSCSFSKDLSEFKMSCSCVEWCKFCVHLRSLNISFLVMVVATALKLCRRGHLQWHDLPTDFLKNLPVGSKIDGWDRHTNRQDDDLISLHFSFRKESTLKFKV
jgi:hypothetical protein